MSDILVKIKNYISKERAPKNSFFRKSYGKGLEHLLFCYTKNKKYYSKLVTVSTSREQSIQIVSDTKELFNESLFRGEYYNGVFYITDIINCSFDAKNLNLENLKYGVGLDAEYKFSFNSITFDEKWEKDSTDTMVIVKDNDFIEIYREKISGKIVRVKNTETAKRIFNLFYAKNELELEVVFNERFEKWEIV